MTSIAEALFSLLDGNGNEVILDENGQLPVINIGGSEIIPLKEWAIKNGISPATARQKAGRGGFMTARKIGRDWIISSSEPNTDHRAALPEKETLSPVDPAYSYRILNYLRRLNSATLPDISKRNKSHRAYCSSLFISLRNRFSGNGLKLFEMICDAVTTQEGADAYYIPHEHIMSEFDDESWHTENKSSSAGSAITIDFKDYLRLLTNTARDMLGCCIELKIHGQTQTLFMPWYHSMSWEDSRAGGLYFVPSNFFKMIVLEL